MAKPASADKLKIPKPQKVVQERRYRVAFTKTGDKVIVREAAVIITDNHFNAGKLCYAQSVSNTLSEAETAKLAQRLGWQFKRTKVVYTVNLTEKLQFIDGYKSRNLISIGNLSKRDFKRLQARSTP